MAIITEDQIEKAIISVFVNNLGYRHLNCFDVDTTERESESDVVIKPVLKRRLKKLNPQLSDEIIEQAFHEICKTRFDQSDIEANREVYSLLKEGVSVNVTTAVGRTEPTRVKMIDFKDDKNNDYLVTSQLCLFQLKSIPIIRFKSIPV